MRLERGAVLHLDGCTVRPDRFQLSSGTRPAPVSVGGSRYESGALIPSAPWRAPTRREREILSPARGPGHRGLAVGVVAVPSSLLRPFSAVREAAATKRSRVEVLELTGGGRFDAAIGALARHVRVHHRVGGEARPTAKIAGGMWVNPPGRTTVTEPPDGEDLIGLHLDNWSDFPVSERASAPNRICVNLGVEDRFFLFVNKPIGEMHEFVSRTRERAIASPERITLVARAFLRLAPSYPVIRVRVGPGEAYVAPTENLVHDASTLGMKGPDVNLTLRGRISLARDHRG